MATTRWSSVALWPWSLVLGLIMVFFAARWAGAAAPRADDAMLRAQLAAGEFAPALAAARRAPTQAQHDAWLAQIALAQAQSGSRGRAVGTAAEIYDDRERKEAIVRLAALPWGGSGGGSQADFDSLIDLITSTIQPTTWDAVGGPGSVALFASGVYVDPQGVLQPLLKRGPGAELAALRAASAPKAHAGSPRRGSPLRMVSLPRLEKQVQLLLATGRQPSDAMQLLAGLRRIQYVFVYPLSGDVVLAGPAGDWAAGPELRIVSTETGEPLLRLDDLVVVFRHIMGAPAATFGCLISPTQEGLARAQAFVQQSNKQPIPAAMRNLWLQQLRAQLGKQDIEVYGLDPRTRAARVMVEADYRMKLIGMGLEPGVPGVESYLRSIKIPAGQAPPPLGVLRWWFTLNYEAVLAAEDSLAFAVRGQGVKVLSENERLSTEGKRIHTGESDELNRQFARNFTTHFDALCAKYPIYAELRNLFDLALVGALLQQQDVAPTAGWHMAFFGDPDAYPVQLGPAPRKVDTVINHRIINEKHIVAGVSGGVSVQPAPLVARAEMETDRSGSLAGRRTASAAKQLPSDAWWWD